MGVGACETKGLRGAASPLLEPGVTPGTAKLTVLSHQAGRQGRDAGAAPTGVSEAKLDPRAFPREAVRDQAAGHRPKSRF